MASSGNFPLWSPLFKNTTSNYNNLYAGNTRFDGNTNNSTLLTDFAIPVGTKFYAEVIAKLGTNYYAIFGIAPPNVDTATYARTQANVYAIEQRTEGSGYTINSISNTTVGSNSSSLGTFNGQIKTFGIAVNRVDNELKLYWDNTLKYTLSIPSTGEYHFMGSHTGGTSITAVHYNFNGGHDSTGAGDTTAGTQTDENGFGEFQYAPPSGFLAPCAANLDTGADIDPGGDNGDTENPTTQFENILYAGNASARSITGLGFQPDLCWIKDRTSTAAYGNVLIDTNRGRAKVLYSHDTRAELSSASNEDLTSFDSDGFSLHTSTNAAVNTSGKNYVAWCWRANGGTTSSNGDGSITATVQANVKAGFSIATYTSPGSGTNHTVGHGLSGVDFIITKNRDSVFNWYCFHKSSADKTYRLNTGTQHSYSNWSMGASTWGSESGYTHDSTDKFVAYCWQNIGGMQKFGSYEGNGSADGPYVYLGFRPRMLFTWRVNSTSGTRVRDSARSTTNPTSKILWWTYDQAEFDNANYNADILSDGFKIRTSSGDFNVDGTQFLYGAWADVPAKYNNAF